MSRLRLDVAPSSCSSLMRSVGLPDQRSSISQTAALISARASTERRTTVPPSNVRCAVERSCDLTSSVSRNQLRSMVLSACFDRKKADKKRGFLSAAFNTSLRVSDLQHAGVHDPTYPHHPLEHGCCASIFSTRSRGRHTNQAWSQDEGVPRPMRPMGAFARAPPLRG